MKRTVLLVDDNKNIRLYCKQELESVGYRVLLAQDGEEALEVLADLRPDVVVLDVCMPRFNGYETLKRINAEQPGLPVIFYTVSPDECDVEFGTRLAAGCVAKSADLAELKAAICRALAVSRAGAATIDERILCSV